MNKQPGEHSTGSLRALTKVELVEHLYVAIATDEELFAYARKEAIAMLEPHQRLTLADMTAGKRYLIACLRNFDVIELRALGDLEGASLWARGAAGACRYRCERGSRKSGS